MLDLSEPQPNEQVNCVIEKETYWKVTWTRTPEGHTPEVTKHHTPKLKSCLKAASLLTEAEKPDIQPSTQPAESGVRDGAIPPETAGGVSKEEEAEAEEEEDAGDWEAFWPTCTGYQF